MTENQIERLIAALDRISERLEGIERRLTAQFELWECMSEDIGDNPFERRVLQVDTKG